MTPKTKFFFIFSLVIVTGILFLTVPQQQPPLFCGYSFMLPNEFDLYSYPKSSNCNILHHDNVVGGVRLCAYPRSILRIETPPHITADNFDSHTKIIIRTLRLGDAPGVNRQFESQFESSDVSHCYVHVLNKTDVYSHYLYFFQEGILSLWFDMTLISQEDANSIVSQFIPTGNILRK